MTNPEPFIPFDDEAEKSLIGCILVSNGEVIDRFPDEIKGELFWTPSAHGVFAACADLRLSGIPVELRTVTTWLKEHGELDAVGGITSVTAMIYGGDSLAEYWLRRLQDQLALRRLQETARWTLKQIRHASEPQSILTEVKDRFSRIEPSGDQANDHALPKVVDEVVLKLDRMDAGEEEPGLRTGIKAWDTLFGGLLPGQYYGLGGRPGLGKSAMMEQMIMKLVGMDEAPVLLFEKDMSLGMLIERMACRVAMVPYWRYMRRMTNFEERNAIRCAVKGIGESRLRLHNPTNLTAEKLCAIVRREQRQHGIQAVFLDHIQLLEVGKELRSGLTAASITISRHAPESNIPHVVLFHINRTGAKGRPSGEDVKEFDQLFGDVDGLAMLWTEAKREELQPGESLPVNFYAPKNRNGAVAEEAMLFDGQLMKFYPAPPAKKK